MQTPSSLHFILLPLSVLRALVLWSMCWQLGVVNYCALPPWRLQRCILFLSTFTALELTAPDVVFWEQLQFTVDATQPCSSCIESDHFTVLWRNDQQHRQVGGQVDSNSFIRNHAKLLLAQFEWIDTARTWFWTAVWTTGLAVLLAYITGTIVATGKQPIEIYVYAGNRSLTFGSSPP